LFRIVVLGCFFALYVLFFGLLLGLSTVRHWQGHAPASEKPSWFLILLIGVATTAALTYLCFRAAPALNNAERWAAFVATGFGVLLLLFSGEFFYDWFHPERQSPDEDFGILIVPFCIAIGLWWCIYLNLPRVRAHLKSTR
jgi:amino acid transporter